MTIPEKVREALDAYRDAILDEHETAAEPGTMRNLLAFEAYRDTRVLAETHLLAALRASDAAATPDAVLREAVDLDVVARSCYSYVGRSLDEEPHLRIAAEVEAERKMRWLRHYVEKYAAPILTRPWQARVAELEAWKAGLLKGSATVTEDLGALRAKLAEAERNEAAMDGYWKNAEGALAAMTEARDIVKAHWDTERALRESAEARCAALGKALDNVRSAIANGVFLVGGDEGDADIAAREMERIDILLGYREATRPDAAKGEG